MKTKAFYLIFAFLSLLQPALQADENPYLEIKFTWARTFHAPIIISVWNYPDDGIFLIRTEIYSGHGGYDWGDSEISSKTLTQEQVNAVIQEFKGIDFPGIFKNYPEAGLDGSSWTFSVSCSGSAFEYTFCSPKGVKEAERMVAFAKQLLTLAEIEMPEHEFY
ncbi:MAG: hypothetical protein ACQKBY_02920 [Verrucomicrobiales bacterium]